MITVTDLSYSFPEKDLYNGISFSIEEGSHAVLVGSNGTGKTTLLNILTDPERYLYDGKAERPTDCTVGYVSQYIRHDKEREITVFEALCEDFVKLQEEIDRLCAEMESAEDFETVFDRYQKAIDAFELVDGYNYEGIIHKQLKLAGLSGVENVPLSGISGGEYKLVQIIRQMLRRPGLLIMDEPDVFLDFENLNGLRDLINSHKGTMLVATHSRFLLNHCFDQVLQLENEGLRSFNGSYTDYTFAQLQLKLELEKAASKDQEWIDLQTRLVERLRKEATDIISPQKGRTLKARVAYLERWQASRTEHPFLEVREPEITFPNPEPVEEEPDWAIRAENYSVSFEDPLLTDVSFVIGPHEKVALVGPNGTGKTTLLRQLYRGDSDALTVNPETPAAFLSQLYGEMLNEENTVADELREAGLETDTEIREHLAKYCFPGERMRSRVKELSGGEKNLLQLAKLALGSARVLLLDEPTSHLDLYAQQALEKAVEAYTGAVLMVSHDFYTVANCVDWVLYAENGTIRRMSGRAFRKMIYKNHFSREYLELEQQKKELEQKVSALIRTSDFEEAEAALNQLEEVIAKL